MQTPVTIAPGWFTVFRNERFASVNICGEIGVGRRTTAELVEAVGDAERVSISINSFGGDCWQALQAYDALQGKQCEVTILENCFSAAVPIALAGKRIRMHAGARLMIHRATLFCLGNEDELHCAARRLEKINLRLQDLLFTHTGQDAATVAQWLSRDTYFTAEQALAAGLVHEVVQPRAVAPAAIAEAAEPPAIPPARTNDEVLFERFLAALGTITVRDKDEFARDLQAWLCYRVRGLSDEVYSARELG